MGIKIQQYIYKHTIMTSVKVKTIPARIVTDRKHIFSAMLNDINEMGPIDFIEMFKETREKYETMPLAIKTKTSKIKVPKLSTQTGWLLYSQEFVTDKKVQAFELFTQFDEEEQNAGKDEKDNGTISAKNFKKAIKKLGIELTTEVKSNDRFKKFNLTQVLRTEAGRCGRKLIRRTTTRRPRSLTLRVSRNGETLTKIAMASSRYLLMTSSPRLRHLDLILRR